nr:class I SAM-dependent methyltransferase [Brevibacillus fulvus]
MFGASGEELWERYFNNSHDLYAVHNQWAAETLADLIQKGRSKILELGVGYGSATQALLAECALRELQIEYTLSDKSLFLLRKARNALKQREEAVITSVAIDINRLEQHAEKQFDLIYAVNVLHCASDIEKTLRDLRGMLSTGGTIVISECVRSGYGHKLHQEFMFSLMPGFEMINHSPDDPAFGFLTPADWQGLLQRAGYRHVEISVNAGGNIRGAIAVGVRE